MHLCMFLSAENAQSLRSKGSQRWGILGLLQNKMLTSVPAVSRHPAVSQPAGMWGRYAIRMSIIIFTASRHAGV